MKSSVKCNMQLFVHILDILQ